MMNNIGIYVHIPFCVRKCNYCDFLSAPADDVTKKRYVDRIIREIMETPELGRDYRVASVYFGGGTPSVLEAGDLNAILGAVRTRFGMANGQDGMSGADMAKSGVVDVETTIECNPGTIDCHKLLELRRGGFNRVSLGLQSALDTELQALGRIHDFDTFARGFMDCRRAGFDNVNVDIMFGLPRQTLKSLEDTLDKVLGLEPEHISAYSLILEEGTPLEATVDRNELPDEDTERQMYDLVKCRLEAAGLEHYEISNFARAGRESVHNLSYWDRGEYLGFGIGAASLFNGVRYKNMESLEDYLCCGNVTREASALSRQDEMEEFMFLGLRKVRDGVGIAEFERQFGQSLMDVYGDVVDQYVGGGFLEVGDGKIRLTDAGINVSNVIMADFLLDGN